MKVIDKLIKLAKGEEIKPFKLKDGKETIYFGEGGKLFYNDDGGMVEWFIYSEWLNQEIEIIEELKEIEKITYFEHNNSLEFEYGAWTPRNLDKAFARKINELIDEVNKLKGDKNE